MTAAADDSKALGKSDLKSRCLRLYPYVEGGEKKKKKGKKSRGSARTIIAFAGVLPAMSL